MERLKDYTTNTSLNGRRLYVSYKRVKNVGRLIKKVGLLEVTVRQSCLHLLKLQFEMKGGGCAIEGGKSRVL